MGLLFKMVAFSINAFLNTVHHGYRTSYQHAQLKRNGNVNRHNCVFWAEDNTHS